MTFVLDSTLASDSIVIGHFELNLLLLMNDSQYPWLTLVPQRADKTEVYQLSDKDYRLFWNESKILSTVLMDLFSGDKLNIAAIGNLVPQLHLHHVVRFKNDNCWPKPIWGQLPMKNYLDKEAELIIEKIIKPLMIFGFKRHVKTKK